MDLHIRYFDPRRIKRNQVVLLVGKRGGGKSTVAETLMSYFTDIPEGICVCPTDSLNLFWTKHLPPLFIHHEYSHAVTHNLLDHQEKKWAAERRRCRKMGIEPDCSTIGAAFVIYDDVTYDKTFLRNTATRRLLMNGRHYNVFVLITCQYLMDIGPDLRNQIDYVFFMKDNNRNSREKIYTYFGGMFPSFESFDTVIKSCTEDRECMVIDNTSSSYTISDCVFFYRATPGLKYKLGSREFWEAGVDGYESDGRDEDDRFMDHAGLSERRRQRAGTFRVNKVYPGQEDVATEPTIRSYRPSRPREYAEAYRRHTTTETPLLSSGPGGTADAGEPVGPILPRKTRKKKAKGGARSKPGGDAKKRGKRGKKRKRKPSGDAKKRPYSISRIRGVLD